MMDRNGNLHTFRLGPAVPILLHLAVLLYSKSIRGLCDSVFGLLLHYLMHAIDITFPQLLRRSAPVCYMHRPQDVSGTQSRTQQERLFSLLDTTYNVALIK